MFDQRNALSEFFLRAAELHDLSAHERLKAWARGMARCGEALLRFIEVAERVPKGVPLQGADLAEWQERCTALEVAVVEHEAARLAALKQATPSAPGRQA